MEPVSPALEREVLVPARGAELHGTMAVPEGAVGIVVLAHGDGTAAAARERALAAELNRSGFATLLVDLLTPDEAGLAERDLSLLGPRTVEVLDWLHSGQPEGRLPLGLLGSAGGAAAALVAAAARPGEVSAVLSRGGRPDLAGEALERVEAPTMLIVGELDREAIEQNQRARARMRAPVRLQIVAGASQLFDEPEALEHAAQLAAAFFAIRLADGGAEGADEAS